MTSAVQRRRHSHLSSSDTLVVRDQNTSVDRDLAIGALRFAVPVKSFYRVCAYESSPTYAADPLDACKDVPRGIRAAVDAGSVLAHRKPIVSMPLRSTSGAVLTGATIGWTTPLGTQPQFKDGGVSGQVVSVLPVPGTNVYCEIKAPKGFLFVNPQCGAMELDWDTVYTRTLVHEPEPKVSIP